MAKDFELIRKLQEFGRRELARRFGVLSPLSGQGIQKGTRFQFKEADGSSVICVIKVAAGDEINRIHFPHVDGVWSTLKDVDRVLYVRQSRSQKGEFEAQMYAQADLLAAFNQNYDHARKIGAKHLPAWLSPEPEPGDRFVGSGFGSKALWTHTGSFQSEEVAPAAKVQPLTIQEAKRGLAAALGISPEAIEIIIRS
jgi:hypothetical protein